MAHGRVRTRADDVADGFEEVLRRLKRRGCNLLVTGTAPAAADRRASRRLLGTTERARRRVLAFPDRAPADLAAYLPREVEPSEPDVWVVERGATTRTPPAASGQAADRRVAAGDALSGLRAEVVRAIGYFDERAGGLSPAELRLGVHSLDVALAAHDRRAVERFVRAVVASVRGVSGMAHYRLPVADDSPQVESISGLFDARIEVRQRDDLPAEHRWHVPNRALTTPWVRL